MPVTPIGPRSAGSVAGGGTIDLPSAPVDREECIVANTGASSATVRATGDKLVDAAATKTILAGQSITFIYFSEVPGWVSVGASASANDALTLPAMPPTTDPAIVGQIWINAGTWTTSTGL